MTKKFIIAFLCAAFFLPALADETIRKINIMGVSATSPELVRVNSGLAEGDLFSATRLEEAVKSIYALGNYADVRMLTTKGPLGYDIEIRVVELPRIDKLVFEGNKKIKDDELRKELSITEGSFVSEAKIFDAIQKMKAKYIAEGRFGVEIQHELSDGKERNTKELVFKINEAKDLRVRDILFDGNTNFVAKTLRKQLDTKRKSFFRSGKFDPEKFDSDIEKLELFYHEKGFIAATVISDSLEYHDDGIYIRITLDEGQKYYYRGASVKGNTVFGVEKISDKLKLNHGDVFNQVKMDESIQNIYFDYTDEGYIHAQVNPQKQIEGDSVFVDITIEEGPRARVNSISVAGNTRTFEKIIRREMALYPGNIFRRNDLVLTQRNIYFLNYFEDVVPEFEILPNGDVDLTMRVTEKPIGRFQIGAGYNATYKLVGNVSIGWPNVFGRGWSADLSYEFGKYSDNFSLSFTEPWFRDTPTSLGFDIYNTAWKWEGYYTEYRRGGAIRIGRKLWSPRFVSVFARYKLESVSYQNVGSSYQPSPAYDITTIDWPRLESSVSFTLDRDSRDSRVFASKGSKNTVSFESAGGVTGGQIEFQKLWLKSDWYLPAHKYVTLVGKAHLGLVENLWSEADEVPFGERFFPGGTSIDGQIRGYVDRTVGPRAKTEPFSDSTAIPDVTGELPLTEPSEIYRPGGRAVLTLNAEIRFPIMRDQLYISFFADAGNAWLTPQQITFSDLNRSLGVGARFVIPMVGIMGLDFGYGFDKSTPDWEVHFQIGPEF